jgi:hypothetical protein
VEDFGANSAANDNAASICSILLHCIDRRDYSDHGIAFEHPREDNLRR